MSRAREQARGLLRTARRSPLLDRAVLRVRWGSLRRLQPEDKWGYERGLPVDRWYIERFLHEHRALIVGHVLEVKQDLYASRFGAEQVAILDIDATNSRQPSLVTSARPARFRRRLSRLPSSPRHCSSSPTRCKQSAISCSRFEAAATCC